VYSVKRTAEFDDWLASIKEGLTRIRLAKRFDKVQCGLLGDVEPVGARDSEMREFFGPGWRVYYLERNGTIIVMWGGRRKVNPTG
jgi:putative addiction module killer protein